MQLRIRFWIQRLSKKFLSFMILFARHFQTCVRLFKYTQQENYSLSKATTRRDLEGTCSRKKVWYKYTQVLNIRHGPVCHATYCGVWPPGRTSYIIYILVGTWRRYTCPTWRWGYSRKRHLRNANTFLQSKSLVQS